MQMSARRFSGGFHSAASGTRARARVSGAGGATAAPSSGREAKHTPKKKGGKKRKWPTYCVRRVKAAEVMEEGK